MSDGHEGRSSQRFARVLLLVAVALAPTCLAGPAAADPPARRVFGGTVVTPLEGVCAFPITITSTFPETSETTFVDKDGQVTRIALRYAEQDTFTNPANGTSLVGLPYRSNSRLLFEDGSLVRGYTTGGVLLVPLPDGTVLRAAGRTEFVASGATFIFSPDSGTPVDVRRLCDVLS